MAIDMSRETAGAGELLPPQLAAEIWQTTQQASAVMQLGTQVPLPAAGKTIPIITGDPTADWVAETDEKPVSRSTLGTKSMTPYKLAVIEPFSEEFRRDLPAVYRELARRLPNSLAVKIDSTVFGVTAPGSNFDTLGGAEAINIGPQAGVITNGTYAGLIEADAKIANADGTLNGWAIAPRGRGLLLSQVDTTGRPLISYDIQKDGTVRQLLGSPVSEIKRLQDLSVDIAGYAGDWSSAMWGTVEGIKIDLSNTASITDGTTSVDVGGTPVEIPNVLNLWQRNMFAIRVEVEFGFITRDLAHFKKLLTTARTGTVEDEPLSNPR
jgi:HK97 family phage major capsid protein